MASIRTDAMMSAHRSPSFRIVNGLKSRIGDDPLLGALEVAVRRKACFHVSPRFRIQPIEDYCNVGGRSLG